MWNPLAVVCLVLALWPVVARGGLSVSSSSVAYGMALTRAEDICGGQNGRKLYLELGERGVLRASNMSTSRGPPSVGPPLGPSATPQHAQCSFELVTCPSCILSITFKHLNLSTCSNDLSCRCDYVWVTEPPYEASGMPFCGVFTEGSSSSGSASYLSQTRVLNIAFFFSSVNGDAFELEYHAERNRQVLGLNAAGNFGKFNNSIGTRGGTFSSPFFPASYPRDLGVEYVINAPEPRARVRLLFSDFQLATSSIMEFYDWNGQRIEVTSGTCFRPPVIVSTGPSLLIRFYANGGSGLGYRAAFTFTTDTNKNPSLRPITDCGGFVENPGGAITMMSMAEEGVKHFDCIWIVKPPRNFFHLKTNLYLKIAQFSEFGGTTELVVRQGTTSLGVALESVRTTMVGGVLLALPQQRAHKELLIPVDIGFYITLRGAFTARSKLAIVYAAFSYMDCFAGADFPCKNHRCISNRLSCDGFDHCGDGSDEPAAKCYQDWSDSSVLDRKWYSNTPNYFFPKMERYPDLKTATLVFLVSSLGLILLIVALIVLLYRMGARARQQRELQSRLQTISELLDGARIDEMAPDEPPTYEAPPDYEEVIKVGSSQPPSTTPAPLQATPGPSTTGARAPQRRKSKAKGTKTARRRAKSSPGVCLGATAGREVALRVALPLSPPPHAPRSHRTSWPEAQGGSAPILLLARTLPSTPVPESPPPPYVTEQQTGSSLSSPVAATASSLPTVRTAPLHAETLLETFEDNFCTAPRGRVPTVPPTDPATALRQAAASEELLTYSRHRRVCALASVEQFEDMGRSAESVSETAQPSTSAAEDLTGAQGPSLNPLNRSDSSPDCSSAVRTNSTELSQELINRSETKSKSYEILQNLHNNNTDIYKQKSEPFFNENTKLLNTRRKNHSSGGSSVSLNFDLQINQLKAQILEHNSKLVEFHRNRGVESEQAEEDVEAAVDAVLLDQGSEAAGSVRSVRSLN